MFIQCQSCHATYKIDEQKIPDQDTFVRCSKCNTPISLNKQEQSALSKKLPHKIVDCSSCGTRYSIPLDKISDGSIPVRCGKCGHVFDVVADEGTFDAPFDTEASSGMVPGPSDDNDLNIDNINIPEENEIQVDGLFDEVDEEKETSYSESEEFGGLDDFEDSDLEEDNEFAAEPKGPTEAYLESVDLSSQINDDDSELDEISDDDKFDLFLKPSPVDQPNEGAAKQIDPDDKQWPDIHDETGPEDSELNDFIELDDLSEIPDSADFDANNPLELQEMTVKKNTNRFMVVGLLIILFILIGTSGWFYFQTSPSQAPNVPLVERYSKQSRLNVMEPLKGRLIVNKASGVNIIMLEGRIRNDNPPETVFNWIEIKVTLEGKDKSALAESTAYAGKIVTEKMMQNASAEELRTIRQEYASVPDLELDTQPTIQFQILFFDVGNDKQTLNPKIRISRLSRKQVP